MKGSHETRISCSCNTKSSVRTADLNRSISEIFIDAIYRPHQLDVNSRPRNGASVGNLAMQREETRETPGVVGNVSLTCLRPHLDLHEILIVAAGRPQVRRHAQTARSGDLQYRVLPDVGDR